MILNKVATSLHLLAVAAVVFLTACSSDSVPTEVSIKEGMFLVNGKPTYEGRYWNGNKVEGLLLNARLVQGIFDDENPQTRDVFAYPDTGVWSPDRNTDEFVAAMPSWNAHGLNSFTINLQGGSPTGYGNRDWINSAFDEEGELKDEYMDRLARILRKADELQMVVILGYFYFGQDQNLKDEAAVKAAVVNATNWILEKGFRNVLVEVNNECNVRSYDHEILKQDRVHELIALVQSIQVDGRRLLVSTSYKGVFVPLPSVVKIADFILLHGNGAGMPGKMQRLIDETKKVEGFRGQPIVVNEDDNYNYDHELNNYKVAIENGVSWGYFDFRRVKKRAEKEGIPEEIDIRIGYQSVPVDWSISHSRKKAFFDYTKEISGY